MFLHPPFLIVLGHHLLHYHRSAYHLLNITTAILPLPLATFHFLFPPFDAYHLLYFPPAYICAPFCSVPFDCHATVPAPLPTHQLQPHFHCLHVHSFFHFAHACALSLHCCYCCTILLYFTPVLYIHTTYHSLPPHFVNLHSTIPDVHTPPPITHCLHLNSFLCLYSTFHSHTCLAILLSHPHSHSVLSCPAHS